MSPVKRNSPVDAPLDDLPLDPPLDGVPLDAPLDAQGLSVEWRTESALAPAVTVGNKPARKKPINARAWRNRASATFTFWLASLTCSSSALNCGSPTIPHHLPRGISSRGRASFHPWSSLSDAVIGSD